MKYMIAKFPGTCGTCHGAINRGDSITWAKGRGAHHVTCPTTGERKPDGPCWECKAPEGFFRNYGSATPVRCDACEAKAKANERTRYGSNYARFAGGGEVFTNRRGRCEDAPCCGCCS